MASCDTERKLDAVDPIGEILSNWPIAVGQHDALMAWAAGFFDGEGCVRIDVQYHKHLKNPVTGLSAAVVNSDPRPIDLLHRLFPAGKRHINRQWRNGKMTPYSEWFAYGRVAYKFCQAILPFSLVKREQLELGIKFAELPWRKQTRGGKGQILARTPEQIATDLDFAARVKALKRVYSTAVEGR